MKEKMEIINEKSKKKTCGLIMPISEIGKYDENHWQEVKECLEDFLEEMEFEVRMVSDNDKNLLIPTTIVKSLYEDDIVVCDISGLNPNVMFELGMRIAFNKSIIIIYDDEQSIPFDIKTIPCIKYPKTLNRIQMKKFNNQLKNRIESTLEKTGNDFISAYGTIKIYQPETKEVSVSKFEEEFLDKLESLNYGVEYLKKRLDIFENRQNKRNQISSISGREIKHYILSDKNMMDLLSKNIPPLDFLDKTIDEFKFIFPNRPQSLLEQAVLSSYKELKESRNTRLY